MPHARGIPDPGRGDAIWGDAPDLDRVSPARVARFLRGLGGRLLSIGHYADAGGQTLVYRFDVAGKEQAFRAVIQESSIDSITGVYPEAVERERELHRQCGIRFTSVGDI